MPTPIPRFFLSEPKSEETLPSPVGYITINSLFRAPTCIRKVQSGSECKKKKSSVADKYHIKLEKKKKSKRDVLFSSWWSFGLWTKSSNNNNGLKYFSSFFRVVFSTFRFTSRLSHFRFILNPGQTGFSHPSPFRCRQHFACWDEIERIWQLEVFLFFWVFYSGHFGGKLKEAISRVALQEHG